MRNSTITARKKFGSDGVQVFFFSEGNIVCASKGRLIRPLWLLRFAAPDIAPGYESYRFAVRGMVFLQPVQSDMGVIVYKYMRDEELQV